MFLVEFQEIHHDDQVRVRQLFNGAPPTARLQKYINNDHTISLAKQQFQQFVGGLDPNAPGYGRAIDLQIIAFSITFINVYVCVHLVVFVSCEIT